MLQKTFGGGKDLNRSQGELNLNSDQITLSLEIIDSISELVVKSVDICGF